MRDQLNCDSEILFNNSQEEIRETESDETYKINLKNYKFSSHINVY